MHDDKTVAQAAREGFYGKEIPTKEEMARSKYLEWVTENSIDHEDVEKAFIAGYLLGTLSG